MIYRGNVVEICNDSIVVFTEDCTFEKIRKNPGLEEGMEVYFEEEDIIKRKSTNIKSLSTVAAAILFVVITSLYSIGFWSSNYRAVALVSVDINPSVEIKVNKNHDVIKAYPINEDASTLPLKDLQGKSLVVALEELVKMANSKGYIKETDTNYILITGVELKSNEQEAEVLEKLLAEGKEKIETTSSEQGQSIEVVTMKSDKETLKKAKEEHVSVGKMEVYQKTNDSSNKENKNTISDFKEKRVKELIKEVQKIKDFEDDKDKVNQNGKPGKEDEKEQKKQNNTDNKEHPVFQEHPRNNKDKEYLNEKEITNKKDKNEDKLKDNQNKNNKSTKNKNEEKNDKDKNKDNSKANKDSNNKNSSNGKDNKSKKP